MDRFVDAHARIRDRLERQLHRTVPDPIWDDLIEDGYPDAASDPEGWEDLVSEARRFLAHVDLGASGGGTHRRPDVAKAPPIEARGKAYGAWAARLTFGDDLQELRASFDGPMTPVVAKKGLSSYAWSNVPLDDLLGRHVEGRLLASDAPRIRGTVVSVDESAEELREGTNGVRFRMTLAYESERRELEVWHASQGSVLDRRSSDDSMPGRLVAPVGTFNAHLVGTCTLYQPASPLTAWQLLWYLLTAEVAEIPALTFLVRELPGAGYRLRDVVTIAVEPWVSARAVAAAYREAQRDAIGDINRPLREKALELARFLAGDGWGRSVRDQQAAWNRLHPDWAISDPRNFRRAGQRAVRQLLGERMAVKDPLPARLVGPDWTLPSSARDTPG